MTATDPLRALRATSPNLLRYLVAVAEQRHIGRAAAACHVAQSTLSAQLAQWERRMKVRVFARDTHGVRVTPLGERIVAAARTALAGLHAVEQAASEARPPFFGPLRLGVIPTAAPGWLPLAVPAIRAAFPGVELPIREGMTAELSAAIEAGRLDAALLAELPGMAARHGLAAIAVEPFVAAVPAGHALARARRVAGAELAAAGLLLLDEGHCLREQALAVCAADTAGGHADAAGGAADYRATSLATLREIVAAGGGTTLLPALAAGDDPRLAIRPLADPDASRCLVLIWRRGDDRAAGFLALAGALRAAVARHPALRTIT